MIRLCLLFLMLLLPAQAITTTNKSLTVGGPNKTSGYVQDRIAYPVGTTGTVKHVIDVTSAFDIARSFFTSVYCYNCGTGFKASVSVNGVTSSVMPADKPGLSIRRFLYPGQVNPGDRITVTLQMTDPRGVVYSRNAPATTMGTGVFVAPVPASAGFLVAAAMALFGFGRSRRSQAA